MATCEQTLNDIQAKVIEIKAKTDLIPNTFTTDVTNLKTESATNKAILEALYLLVTGENYNG